MFDFQSKSIDPNFILILWWFFMVNINISSNHHNSNWIVFGHHFCNLVLWTLMLTGRNDCDGMRNSWNCHNSWLQPKSRQWVSTNGRLGIIPILCQQILLLVLTHPSTITLVGNSNDPPQKNSESLYCIISYTVVS